MEDDDPGVAIVRCKGCGRIKGTFNDLKSKAVQKSLDVILVKVRNALKK